MKAIKRQPEPRRKDGVPKRSPQIKLKNADRLTMFADYRVPQILRELGIMIYDENLIRRIDSKIELRAHSYEEIE